MFGVHSDAVAVMITQTGTANNLSAEFTPQNRSSEPVRINAIHTHTVTASDMGVSIPFRFRPVQEKLIFVPPPVEPGVQRQSPQPEFAGGIYYGCCRGFPLIRIFSTISSIE